MSFSDNYELNIANNIHPMAKLSEIRRKFTNKGITLLDFSMGDSIEPTPSLIIKSMKHSITRKNRYPRTKGNEELRIACSNYINKRYSLSVNPKEEIAITSGNKEGIFHYPLSLRKLNSEKKYIIYGTPAYPGYANGCLYSNYLGYPLQLKEKSNFLLPFWEIPKNIAKKTLLLWINYPHNPTGAVADISYLKQLYDFCLEYNIIIGSDDCYADLWYQEPPPSITQVNMKNVISFHSCSKRSGMAGLRSGFMYGDCNLINNYLMHRAFFGNDSSTIIQKTSEIAWTDENHVSQQRNSISRKASLLINRLTNIGITFPSYSAGIFLWGKLPNKSFDIDYFEKCLKKNILIIPSSYLCGKKNYIRISLCSSITDCRKSLNLWPIP